MRILLFIVLFSVCSVLGLEMLLTDEERTKQSAAVFTGTVISTNFLRELQWGALYSAQVRVETVEKSYPDLKTNAVVFYEWFYRGTNNKGGFRMHGVTCPGYPEITVGQRLRLWCVRQTVEGHTNVLFVPTLSWATRQ